jgi:hypothetical protein
LSAVNLPVLVVDRERLAGVVFHDAVCLVVGLGFADGLILDGRVERVVDAGRGHAHPKLVGFPPVDAELLGVAVQVGGALPLPAAVAGWVVERRGDGRRDHGYNCNVCLDGLEMWEYRAGRHLWFASQLSASSHP